MELWIDSVNFPSIKEINAMGLLHGVTTNPQILAKSPLSPAETFNTLLEIQNGPITAQVTEQSSDAMIEQGLKLAEISDRILVKIPACPEGYKAMNVLKKNSINIMATVIFDTSQALCSLHAGADYLAAYISRMDDENIKAFEILAQIQHILDTYHFDAKLMGASLKSNKHLLDCIELGVASVTLKETLFLSITQNLPIVKKNINDFSHSLSKGWI